MAATVVAPVQKCFWVPNGGADGDRAVVRRLRPSVGGYLDPLAGRPL